MQDDASAGAVRVRGVSLIFLTAVLAAGPARAEISVTVARIAEGYLWVIGQAAEPEVEIRLDDRFVERTDRRGNFQFRFVHHPADCVVPLATPA